MEGETIKLVATQWKQIHQQHSDIGGKQAINACLITRLWPILIIWRWYALISMGDGESGGMGRGQEVEWRELSTYVNVLAQ